MHCVPPDDEHASSRQASDFPVNPAFVFGPIRSLPPGPDPVHAVATITPAMAAKIFRVVIPRFLVL